MYSYVHEKYWIEATGTGTPVGSSAHATGLCAGRAVWRAVRREPRTSSVELWLLCVMGGALRQPAAARGLAVVGRVHADAGGTLSQ